MRLVSTPEDGKYTKLDELDAYELLYEELSKELKEWEGQPNTEQTRQKLKYEAMMICLRVFPCLMSAPEIDITQDNYHNMSINIEIPRDKFQYFIEDVNDIE